MTPESNRIYVGDCVATMKAWPDACVDAVVTDPPYELGFMGKAWDSTGIAYSVEMWREVLRVLKPGGHLLAFSATRTYHRMACAIEDAGFDIRDQVQWLYGSGFPKSLNVAMQLDKMDSVETRRERWRTIESENFKKREVVGTKMAPDPATVRLGVPGRDAAGRPLRGTKEIKLTKAHTDLAKRWEGWGTALKPANEPICLARKPLDGTVADNVMTWGTGALNIQASRIGDADCGGGWGGGGQNSWKEGSNFQDDGEPRPVNGRWPANILFGHAPRCVCTGTREVVNRSGSVAAGTEHTDSVALGEYGPHPGFDRYGGADGVETVEEWACVPGCAVRALDGQRPDASRFFYVAKPDTAERNMGLEGERVVPAEEVTGRKTGSAGLESPRAGKTSAGKTSAGANFHPTVKPVDVMAYLIRMVTPPGGVVLDPFMGSGTTGIAAARLGHPYLGCEMDPAHVGLAEKRIAAETIQGKLF